MRRPEREIGKAANQAERRRVDQARPAFLDFKLVFTSTGESVKYEDPTRQYRFEGFKAIAKLEASVRVPSLDFAFKTDPLDTSKCDFAVMGSEVNGKYYELSTS